jgi:hypothetical protein
MNKIKSSRGVFLSLTESAEPQSSLADFLRGEIISVISENMSDWQERARDLVPGKVTS